MQGVLGTFDSLNPLIVKGLAVQDLRGYVIESLMARGYDEPFTLYGLLARTVETDDARSYVTFALDPAAHFSDGAPVTADGRDFLLAAAARSRPAELPHLLLQSGQGRGARCAHRAVRSQRQQRPRTAAYPRADAGPAGACDRRRHLRRHDAGEAGRQRALTSSATSIRARASLSSAIRIIGAARSRSIAACGISPSCVLTITATPTPISKHSKPASMKCAPSAIRAAGRLATIFLRCATGASSKKLFRQACPRSPRTLSSIRGGRCFPISVCARRILLLFDAEWVNRNFFFDLYRRSASFFDDSELSAYHRPADERERALLKPYSRRRPRRRARRHLVATGHRRLGPRPRKLAAGARTARRRRAMR